MKKPRTKESVLVPSHSFCLFVTLGIITHQAPLSRGFSRQEYWSGLPFPSPGDLPNPGIEPVSPALAGRFFTPALSGKPQRRHKMCNSRYRNVTLKMGRRREEWTEKGHIDLSKINFYWSTVALQCWAGFYCTAKWISHTCTFLPSLLDLLPIQVTTGH